MGITLNLPQQLLVADMNHSLVYHSENEFAVRFECSKCGTPVEFVLPGLGNPHAIKTDNSWTFPDNPEQWMGQCEGAK